MKTPLIDSFEEWYQENQEHSEQLKEHINFKAALENAFVSGFLQGPDLYKKHKSASKEIENVCG